MITHCFFLHVWRDSQFFFFGFSLIHQKRVLGAEWLQLFVSNTWAADWSEDSGQSHSEAETGAPQAFDPFDPWKNGTFHPQNVVNIVDYPSNMVHKLDQSQWEKWNGRWPQQNRWIEHVFFNTKGRYKKSQRTIGQQLKTILDTSASATPCRVAIVRQCVQVTYQYPTQSKPAIRDVDLEVSQVPCQRWQFAEKWASGRWLTSLISRGCPFISQESMWTSSIQIIWKIIYKSSINGRFSIDMFE